GVLCVAGQRLGLDLGVEDDTDLSHVSILPRAADIRSPAGVGSRGAYRLVAARWASGGRRRSLRRREVTAHPRPTSPLISRTCETTIERLLMHAFSESAIRGS